MTRPKPTERGTAMLIFVIVVIFIVAMFAIIASAG
jgi:hypothetical protein